MSNARTGIARAASSPCTSMRVRLPNLLERLSELARELQHALADLDIGAGTWLEHELRREIYLRTEHVEDNDCVSLYRDHVSFLGTAAGQAADKARKNLKSRGRPPGVKQGDPQHHNFIRMVAFETVKAGGKLVVNKGTETGMLFDLLDALRPYLPPGFLPPRDIRPASTYQRIVAMAARAAGPKR